MSISTQLNIPFLPQEIYAHIIKFAAPNEDSRLCLVCKSFKEHIEEKRAKNWKKILTDPTVDKVFNEIFSLPKPKDIIYNIQEQKALCKICDILKRSIKIRLSATNYQITQKSQLYQFFFQKVYNRALFDARYFEQPRQTLKWPHENLSNHIRTQALQRLEIDDDNETFIAQNLQQLWEIFFSTRISYNAISYQINIPVLHIPKEATEIPKAYVEAYKEIPIQLFFEQESQLTTIPKHLKPVAVVLNNLKHIPPCVEKIADSSVIIIQGDIPSNLSYITKIPELQLASNNLIFISPKLAQLTSLKFLSLSNNRIQHLPPELGQLHRLEVLSLSNNKIASLPDEYSHLHALHQLDLSENNLILLPACIPKLPSLKELHLDSNQLCTLPKKLNQLPLRILDIGNNYFSILPECVTEIKSLKLLALYSNNLSILPDNIANLTSLKYLNVAKNNLKTLSLCISHLQSLKQFYAQENQLTQLPKGLKQCLSLKKLRLNNNQLKDIPDLRSLPKLCKINLRDNPPEIMQNLSERLPEDITLIIDSEQATHPKYAECRKRFNVVIKEY